MISIPNGSSAEEIQAIIDKRGQQRPSDIRIVVDVGFSWGSEIHRRRFAANPTRSPLGTPFPDSVKDKDGYWYGDYLWPHWSFEGQPPM